MSVETKACPCGAKIMLLPTPSGATMPVDVGRDPHGNLVAVQIPGKGWGVRVLTDRERDEGTTQPRYTPHWSTCPQPEQYRATARNPGTGPARLVTAGPTREGPCARCRQPHPNRYGPGPASPLCASCRGEAR